MMGLPGWYYLRKVSLIGYNPGTDARGWKTDLGICSYADGEE